METVQLIKTNSLMCLTPCLASRERYLLQYYTEDLIMLLATEKYTVLYYCKAMFLCA